MTNADRLAVPDRLAVGGAKLAAVAVKFHLLALPGGQQIREKTQQHAANVSYSAIVAASAFAVC